jgi:hypothetical protein
MKSPFDALPRIASAKLPSEPYPGATGVVGQVFLNTDTTYKFFWFLRILGHGARTCAATLNLLGPTDPTRLRSGSLLTLELCHARPDLESDTGATLGKPVQVRRGSQIGALSRSFR